MIEPVYSAAPYRYEGKMKYRRLARVEFFSLRFHWDCGITSAMWIHCKTVGKSCILPSIMV